jgi:hypothetical protein
MSAFGGKADITATERNSIYGFRKSSGSLAMFAAIRGPDRASAISRPIVCMVKIAKPSAASRCQRLRLDP